MGRIAYINGHFISDHLAQVDFHDRGYHFADGMYEVAAYYNQQLLDWQPHLARLHRSLGELNIPAPLSDTALTHTMQELVRRNRQRHGLVYLQITRGTLRRNHAPNVPLKPNLTLCILPENKKGRIQAHTGIAVITGADERWARCNIKSIALLPNTIAKGVAQGEGVYEMWQMREENGTYYITEGSTSNSYIVDGNDTLITHPANQHILGGIVREQLLRLADKAGIAVEERPFTREEAYDAKEALLTSSSAHILPVTKIDNHAIGNGAAGAITRRLQVAYDAHVMEQTNFDLKSIPND